MELNREQIRYKMSEKHIIRALECLSKPHSTPADREKCYFMWKEPSCFSCYHEVAQNALALIKELTEENESLTATVKTRGETIENLQLLMSKVNEDNERLTEENEKIGIENFDLVCELSRIKEDTVRNMQERLTDFFNNDDTVEYIEVDAVYINEQIEKIAKEMLDGEKDNV